MPPQEQDISKLSADDHRRIEDEHARLEQFLRDLRETCTEFGTNEDCHDCSREKLASCQGRLTSFVYDFIDLVAEHFENEEKIMHASLPEVEHDTYLVRHMAEHARLLHAVKDLMQTANALSRQGRPVAAIRMLDREIFKLFGEHTREFDAALLHPTHKHS